MNICIVCFFFFSRLLYLDTKDARRPPPVPLVLLPPLLVASLKLPRRRSFLLCPLLGVTLRLLLSPLL